MTFLSLLPTPAGFAVFLKHGSKISTIYIDPSVGVALPYLSGKTPNPRPLTHDMVHDMMQAFGITLRNACITALQDGVFLARIILEMKNEIGTRKIVELDVRCSDAMALALRLRKPLCIVPEIWDGLEDLSAYYEELKTDGDIHNMIDLQP